MKANINVLALLVISTIIFFVYFGFLFSLKIKTYSMSANVISKGRKFGISVDPFELNFGRVTLGTGVRKVINIRNNYDMPIRVIIDKEGSIEPYVHIGRENFLLEAGKQVNITISFRSFNAGNYTGTIKVITKIPRYRWVLWML